MEPFIFSSASGSFERVMKFSLIPAAGHDCHSSASPSGAPIGTSLSNTRTSASSIAGCLGPASTITWGGVLAAMFLAI